MDFDTLYYFLLSITRRIYICKLLKLQFQIENFGQLNSEIKIVVVVDQIGSSDTYLDVLFDSHRIHQGYNSYSSLTHNT